MFKKIALTAALIVLPSALAAQLWSGFPIVNGPSYCNATNNNVCTQTVPAGPDMTGNETIPLDTNLSNGATPQTAKIGLPALGAGTLVVSVPLTGATLTVTQQERQRIVNPAGTIAELTINLPAASSSMVNGQRWGLCGTQIVTALTLGAGSGNTFGSTVTSQAMLVPVVTGAASCMEWIYSKTSAAAGVWYRTQ